jgi:hypothetical protein
MLLLVKGTAGHEAIEAGRTMAQSASDEENTVARAGRARRSASAVAPPRRHPGWAPTWRHSPKLDLEPRRAVGRIDPERHARVDVVTVRDQDGVRVCRFEEETGP